MHYVGLRFCLPASLSYDIDYFFVAESNAAIWAERVLWSYVIAVSFSRAKIHCDVLIFIVACLD